MLSTSNLNIAAAASKDSYRNSLNYIMVSNTETVATDGHMMFVSERAEVGQQAKDLFVPAQVALDTAKLAKKAKSAAGISNGGENIRLTAGTASLETPCENVTFPNWKAVMVNNDGVFTSFNPALLAQVATIFAKAECKSITLRLSEKDEPCNYAARIDGIDGNGQHMTALVMPMRASGGKVETGITQKDWTAVPVTV